MISKVLAGVIIVCLLVLTLGGYSLIIFGAVLLLWIIRLIADGYWKGKDKKWW